MYMEIGLWLLLELSTWDPIINRDQLSLSLRSNNAESWYWYHCYQCMTIRYHRDINPASIAQSSKFEFTCPWSSEFCWKHDFASLVFSLFLNGSNSSRKEFALSVNNFFFCKKTPKGIMDFFLNNEESESCLSCMGNTYWSFSSSLPNMKAIHWRIKVP